MTETRSSLIRDVRDPQHPRWGEFHRIYDPLVRNYLRKKGLRNDDIDEVTQIVFTKLSQAMADFELDRQRSRFRTWLWRVTCNALLDWVRARQRQQQLAAGYAEHLVAHPPADHAEPEPDWLDEHHRQTLAYVLDEARRRHTQDAWTCFEQRVLLNRPAEEVARELGKNANAVYIAACRVLKFVRERCREREEELGSGGHSVPER